MFPRTFDISTSRRSNNLVVVIALTIFMSNCQVNKTETHPKNKTYWKLGQLSDLNYQLQNYLCIKYPTFPIHAIKYDSF